MSGPTDIELLRARWARAARRGEARAPRLLERLQAAEAAALVPPPPAPVPRLREVPFYEYAVVGGARIPDPVINAPVDTPHPGRSPVPPPLPDPGPPTYDVRPGARMKDPQ